MLTPLVEFNGREKCAKYWPCLDQKIRIKDSKEGSDAVIEVENISERVLQTKDTILREFRMTLLENGQVLSCGKVFQLHFEGCDDHSIPKNEKSMVSLIETASSLRLTGQVGSSIPKLKEINHNSSAIIVHCSAGVGRSGIFIALHHLFHVLERPLEEFALESDIVFETVDEMRKSRPRMV